MPGLNSAMYAINSWTSVSADLVEMVKEFVKAAIRTDPRDLLQWLSTTSIVFLVDQKTFSLLLTPHSLLYLCCKSSFISNLMAFLCPSPPLHYYVATHCEAAASSRRQPED